MSGKGVKGHDTPAAGEAPPAHPLAEELALRLSAGLAARENAVGGPGPERFGTELPADRMTMSPHADAGYVLLLGIGNGRNLFPLRAAGLRVDVVEDDAARVASSKLRFATDAGVDIARASYAGPFPFQHRHAGALSTHALLHGTRHAIAAAVAAARDHLVDGAPFYTTLGSTNDPRFGTGHRIDDQTFAAVDGSEAGVPHGYFDESGARTLFASLVLESIVEVASAQYVGRWIHRDAEAERIVHWFVRARRPSLALPVPAH